LSFCLFSFGHCVVCQKLRFMISPLESSNIFLFLKSTLKLRVFNRWESFQCIILKYYSLSYDLFKTMSRIGHTMIGDTDDGHGYPYEHPFSQIVLQ